MSSSLASGPFRESDGSDFSVKTRLQIAMAWGYRTSATAGEGLAICLVCGQTGVHVHSRAGSSEEEPA